MDGVFLDLIQSFINTTIDFRKSLVAGNDLSMLVKVIVGFAIVIHIASIAYPAIIHNRAIDFYSMGKPFVIGLIALNINLLLVPIDGIGDAILENAKSLYDKQLHGFSGETPSDVLEQLKQSQAQIAMDRLYGRESGVVFESDKPFGPTFVPDPEIEAFINKNLSTDDLQKVAEGDVDISESANLMSALISQSKSFIWGAFNVVYLLMIFLQQFYLAVLGVLGSFAVAMSIFPAFSSSFTEWLGRYISVSLWGPIAVIIKSILQRIIAGVLSTDLAGLPSSLFMCDVFTLLMAILLFFTPALAGFCIQASGGMGALQGYIHNKLSSARHATISDIGYKTEEGIKSLQGLHRDYTGYRAEGVGRKDALSQVFRGRYEGAKGFAGHLKDFATNSGIHSKERKHTINQIAQGLMNVGFSSGDAVRFANDIVDQYSKDSGGFGEKVGGRPDGSGSTSNVVVHIESSDFTVSEPSNGGATDFGTRSEVGGRSSEVHNTTGDPEPTAGQGSGSKTKGGQFTFNHKDDVKPRFKKDARYRNTGSVTNGGQEENVNNNN